jgi:cobalt/nickel transport protein
MKMEKSNKYTIPLIITFLLAGVFSLFASSHPDGLERVAMDSGFIEKERATWSLALFPDYQIPMFADNVVANSLVGVIGVICIYTFVSVIGKFLIKRRVGA